MAEGRTAFAVEPDGWYVEPTSSTEFLLDREAFRGLSVWDPACGKGNVVKTLRSYGVAAYGTDLRHRVRDEPEHDEWFAGELDFLNNPFRPVSTFDAIVTNPPYGNAKTAEEFIRRALAYEQLKKLAVFVNAKFLFSRRRAEGLFKEHPPSRVWPVLPRPSCPPGQYLDAGNKAGGGVADYLWMVWDRGDPPAWCRPATTGIGW